MAGSMERNKHFILRQRATSEPFQQPVGGGGQVEVPPQDRARHGKVLLTQFASIKSKMEQARVEQEDAGLEEGFGLQIEFESFPDIELAFDSLAKERSGIELLNVRHEEKKTLVTVFVPDGKLHILENLIVAYLEKDTKLGKPRNQKLVDAIRSHPFTHIFRGSANVLIF